MVKFKEGNNSQQENLGGAIEGFLQEKYVQAPNTATAYEGDIKEFIGRVFEETVETVTASHLESLDYEKLAGYRGVMYNEMASGTVNRKLSSIKSLYKHLRATGVLSNDISFLDLVKNVRDKDLQSYPHMEREVIEQYMKATELELHKKKEKKMLIKLASDTGFRIEELLSLKKSQFTQMPNGMYNIKGVGKGGKSFSDNISGELYEELMDIGVGGEKVFSLSRKNVWDMMQRLDKITQNEDKGYVFHSLKKSAVTFTHRRTGSIAQAMKKGRHSRPETVMRYLEDTDEGLTGMFSSEEGVDDKLYSKVSHEELLKGLKKMDKNSLLLLNIALDKLKN